MSITDLKKTNQGIVKFIKNFPVLFSSFCLILLLFEFGFDQSIESQKIIHGVYVFSVIIGITSIIFRYTHKKKRYRPKKNVLVIDFLLMVYLSIITITNIADLPIIFNHIIYLYIAIFFVFIREISTISPIGNKKILNPAQIFIISFIILILTGTFMLMLPNATISGISFVDAIFTSTSAVCVTGLIVVDTGSYFTLFGQTVILFLIQLGGIGIMTFASYFSYFFKGTSSYKSQLQMKEMTNAKKLSDVFNTLKKIIFLTVLVELSGAVFIYFSIEGDYFLSISEKFFFSIFHAVSGFCNAGFSTLSNSIYEPAFRFNYPFHISIALLFIIGGLGFPIILNFFYYLKYILVRGLSGSFTRKRTLKKPWIINLNTRLVATTTLVLILSGTIAFYIFEYNNTLAEHQGIGKVITAFFGAVTPRTAGFNTVDTANLNYSTIILVICLMWIGASPASTGGGIKTSTFAVGILNVISLAKGKKHIEYFGREISEFSIRRAFGIMTLSIVVIALSVFLITLIEENMSRTSILFESVSAFGTVGLSMGITSDLTNTSKIILVFTMFIGRISMLTILIAILKKTKMQHYSYPTEDILIN